MTVLTENKEEQQLSVERRTFASDGGLDAILHMDRDGHGAFRDLCVIYGDFHRPVFLQEFLTWFIRNASKDELAVLRNAISTRAPQVAKGGKKGRPRAQDDKQWLVSAKTAAWRRIVDRWTWRKIGQSEGMRPTRKNIRTIERTLIRRVDQYAAIVWEASSQAGAWRYGSSPEANIERVKNAIDTARFRQWLWIKAGLFGPSLDDHWISGCKQIVLSLLSLLSRGEKAAGQELVRHVQYHTPKQSGHN